MATQHINFNIQGMTCQACANRIEKVLNKKEFVSEAVVNFAGETAQITFDDTQTNPDELIKIIEKTGFQAAVQTSLLPETDSHESHWRVWTLLALSLPFWVGMLGMLGGSHALMPPLWLQIAIATVAQTYFALPFYKGAIASVRGGLANMDVLVSVGTLSIYLYSLGMVLAGHAHHVYFEAGVMVLAFVSLGKYLEAKTKRGSLNALGSLLQLTPRDVQILQNNQWQTVKIDQVKQGDILRCVQGERIAADGEVVSGEGWADESHLTGESQPVYKTIGNKVLAGSILSGSLDYRAESLGSDTLLGDMVAALADAQGSKAPIARLADKVAAVFVPSVLAISLLTLVANWLIVGDFTVALVRAVAVLVVACPCALGLATPAAIMAGMGQAVQHGVWFKNAAALEMAGAVDTVILDKTGTLTQGKPDIAAIWTADNFTENQLFEIAAAVEQHAVHPLANAIVQAAFAREIAPLNAENVNTVAGEGIGANIDDLGDVKVGKLDFCGFRLPESLIPSPRGRRQTVSDSNNVIANPDNPLPQGEGAVGSVWQIASLVAVSLNNQPVGAFALADPLKPDSLAAIQRLREHNIAVHILSGDNAATVAHIAQQLGLPENHAHGNQSPRQKAEFIQQLQQQGAKVAMAGDGINDAPALALADVGFAVRGSTDIAEQSADAVLVQQSVNQLASGLIVARATLSAIKQNLFFAFIYNALGIPFAAVGLLTPVLAGAMMAMSSVSVLGNALRLKRMKF
ncbi:heavy metal translocating P-type ATPase [Kingella kingae]|uniref:heavy metal translocating P-type ATPase n=1 Tax=Kingella kingae TaxID=504 RepID=UPI00254D0271|nr:heavy metal translocating P-type ATPase [Kingella kingae]MDK4576090.1 heavy metal translocating P-type ATPase [Kingella kingae]MDK4581967.1 heavy metal translocating P-type ATPase [Kingella kingae]MDK4591760.1 heavy metal translocating P-type ATPase [Kingella kingae]MDK4594219.1 heavy metal translocating P-type ATPase [Kingella kingae]MDK4643829.1 heavy metal translocating P-type ATPase [Kingella kingae]